MPKDDAEALRWFRKAADQGDARAEYGMGFIYYEGRGAQQDYAEAVRWYRKAADQGNALAEYELGYMYHHGYGVSQDYAEAARWYRKAADKGDAHAEAGIGFLYYYGYGVPQDRAEGRRWIRKAADQGDDYALRTVSAKLTGWRRFDLLFRLIAGILLTMGFLQPGKDRWSLRLRIAPLTGILCIFTAGLSWYGYLPSIGTIARTASWSVPRYRFSQFFRQGPLPLVFVDGQHLLVRRQLGEKTEPFEAVGSDSVTVNDHCAVE